MLNLLQGEHIAIQFVYIHTNNIFLYSGISVHVVSPGYIRTNLSRSAITGNGSTYNKMDETTAKGADPDDVAITILNSIANGKTDFIVAATLSAKIALWLKFLAPTILQSMLVNRYEKQSKKS